jgi:hypothetical protein
MTKKTSPKKKTPKLTLSVSALKPLKPSQLQQVSGAGGYGRHYGWTTPGR